MMENYFHVRVNYRLLTIINYVLYRCLSFRNISCSHANIALRVVYQQSSVLISYSLKWNYTVDFRVIIKAIWI